MYELHPIGAPKRPEFNEILRILFTPQEATGIELLIKVAGEKGVLDTLLLLYAR